MHCKVPFVIDSTGISDTTKDNGGIRFLRTPKPPITHAQITLYAYGTYSNHTSKYAQHFLYGMEWRIL